jgi:hypothetical protein
MGYSKILGRDPKEITQQQAAIAWVKALTALMGEQGDGALQQLKALEPDLWDRVNQSDQAAGEPLANDVPRAFPTAVPAGDSKALFLGALHLPASTTDGEFATAWKSNGGRSAPVNARNIFASLVGHLAEREKLSVADARDIAKQKFGVLAALAGQTEPDQPGATISDTGDPAVDYGRNFAAALQRREIANDPIRAHSFVMSLPNAATRFKVTNQPASPRQIASIP